MKILAFEQESGDINWDLQEDTLKDEANTVYRLYQSGIIREIYFTDDSEAVLILECENKLKAKEILDSLPLVKKGLIGFNIMELKPYTGFNRILNLNL
jgi:hypothetical protein